MKWFLMVALAVGVIGALSLVGASQGGFPPEPYIGAWESVDLDGSYQRLMIGGGPRHSMSIPIDPCHIVYFDHGATACGGGQAIAIGYGMEVMMDDTYELVAELAARCLKSGEALGVVTPMFTYLADGDVLAQETAEQCDDDVDDDGDTYVNDGCPAADVPETGAGCANDIDDDTDGYVNDGCPTLGVPETDGEPIMWQRQGRNVGHPQMPLR